MSFSPNIVIMCFALLLCLSGDSRGKENKGAARCLLLALHSHTCHIKLRPCDFTRHSFGLWSVSKHEQHEFLRGGLALFICLSLFACAYLYTEACLMCTRSKERQCAVIRTFPPSWYSSIYLFPREQMLLLSLHANVNVQRRCMQYLSFWWAEVLCLESRLCGNADTANLFSILLLWWAPTRLVCHL